MTGRRIVNTRATHQLSRLTTLLEQAGATVVEYPCIAIVAPEDTKPLTDALQCLASYDWLVLTSANTVAALSSLGVVADGLKVAAVGSSTANAVKAQLGRETALLPEHFTAESLAQALPIQPGERVLIPSSAIAGPALADILTQRGAKVTVVEAYRSVLGAGGENVPALLAQKQIDAVTFTSASTVANFLTRLDSEGGRRPDLACVCIACIGPQTAAMAQAQGLVVSVMPEVHTLYGLVAALAKYFS